MTRCFLMRTKELGTKLQKIARKKTKKAVLPKSGEEEMPLGTFWRLFRGFKTITRAVETLFHIEQKSNSEHSCSEGRLSFFFARFPAIYMLRGQIVSRGKASFSPHLERRKILAVFPQHICSGPNKLFCLKALFLLQLGVIIFGSQV